LRERSRVYSFQASETRASYGLFVTAEVRNE
jgi:hypothetical protein